MKKVLLIVLSYVIFSFFVAFAVVAFFQTRPTILPGDVRAYIALQAALLFFGMFPAVVCSGFLVGCAVSFGREIHDDAMRTFSHLLLNSILFVFLLFSVGEAFVPFLQKKQAALEEAPVAFSKFMTLSRKCYADGRMLESAKYANEALLLNPSSEDAMSLRELALANEDSVAEAQREKKKKERRTAAAASDKIPFLAHKKETPQSLLEKARAAERDRKWFDSHYNARLAESIAGDDASVIAEAESLAQKAWKELRAPNVFVDTPEIVLFRRKLKAYTMFVSGDNVGAYYEFLAISNSSPAASRDPDVIKYLALSSEEVQKERFFTDDMENLQRFESQTGVHFSLKKADGTVDVVYIQGITSVKDAGSVIKYLRGLYIYEFGADGYFNMSIHAPYAKLMFEDVGSFDKKTKERFSLPEIQCAVPKILLNGIDSRFSDKRSVPEFKTADGSEIDKDEWNYIVLGLSSDDFNLLCDSSIGSDRMSLISLWRVFGMARQFGYSSEVFGASLLRRITYPLTLLILFVFLACISWNYRLAENQIFKFKWIYILPISTFILYFCLEFIKFALKLMNYVFIAFAGYASVAMSLACLIAVFAIVSAAFVKKVSKSIRNGHR